MSTVDVTGVCAAAMGVAMALSPLLQARRVRVIGDSSEVSLGLYAVMVVNAVAWILHGIATHDLVLVIPNTTGLAIALVTLRVIQRYRPQDVEVNV